MTILMLIKDKLKLHYRHSWIICIICHLMFNSIRRDSYDIRRHFVPENLCALEIQKVCRLFFTQQTVKNIEQVKFNVCSIALKISKTR